MVEVKLYVPVKFSRPTVFLGFQGAGLVGTLTAGFLADALKLEQIGYIKAKIPPYVNVVNSKLRFPISIRGNRNIVVIQSEVPVHHSETFEMAEKIVKFAKSIKAKEIIALEGIGARLPPEEINVYAITDNKKMAKKLAKVNIPTLKNGIIIGVSGAALLQSMSNKIDSACLVSECHSQYPDGQSAVTLLEKIKQLYKLDIDTQKLRMEAEKFESKLKKLIEKTKSIEEISKRPERIYGD